METSNPTVGRQGNPLVIKVKALLMRAWRERWNEVQWGIQLKRVMTSTPGDSKDLAELLLQQALVGTHPNSLILSYVKHAIFSQPLSYPKRDKREPLPYWIDVQADPSLCWSLGSYCRFCHALALYSYYIRGLDKEEYIFEATFSDIVLSANGAFRYIINFEDHSRPFCLLGLIDLAQDFVVNLSNWGDGGITLCKTMQNLLHWLLKVMLKSVQKFQDAGQQDYINVLDAAATAVLRVTESSTIRGLLYIARNEETETYRELEQTELNVRGTMSQLATDAISPQIRQNVSTSLKALSRVQDMVPPTDAVLEVTHLPICPTLVAIVTLEAVLNPTNDIQPFVDQLLVTEKLMKLQRPYVYCELFRACYMGLLDIKENDKEKEEMKWSAFTFLKMPQVLLKMQQLSPSHDLSIDLEQGFDRLLGFSHMLDLTDIKLNCDCLMYLLNECKKLNLLSDGQYNRLTQRRSSESQKPRPQESSTQPCPSLIIRAEPTVTSILKTLDADYSKNQDALLSVLCQLVSGKSFELILAAAAATGKLNSFALKLIKINEFAKHGSSDPGKTSQTRALLFDISFLMLCHVTQVYGMEILTAHVECFDTFFVQWAVRCLPEDGKYKSVDISMPVDSNKVDAILSAFTSGTEITSSVAKWHEICINAPYAIQEVLFAWEHGALSADGIKMILGYVKTRILCLPVVISAWLCSYLNMLSDDARAKPLTMLQQLTHTLATDTQMPQYYNERYHLMSVILQKMVHEILPPSKRPPSPNYVPANTLPSTVMAKTVKYVFTKGWVDIRSLYTLEYLVNLCGTDWFTDRLVKHMLETNRTEDLTLNLSLVFAMSHLDLEHITLSLLLHTLPRLLLSSEKQTLLTDPKGYTLAKYCVLVVSAAQTAKSGQKEVIAMYRRGRKRSRKEFDLEDLDDLDSRPQKRSKTMEPQITLDSEGFNFDFLNSKEDGESSPTIDTKDPLNKALINLFRLMNAIVIEGNISPRISFIVSLLDEAVKCGQKHSRYILQMIPPNMLSQLIKCLPGVFTNEHILQLCDLSNSNGRKIAAKALCQNSRFTSDETG